MIIKNKLFRIANNIITAIEESPAPFHYFVFTFFSAVTLRNFIEYFSDHTPQYPILYLHYYTSYLALALSISLIFYFCTKTAMSKIIRMIFSFFLIVITAPILDLLFSYGQGYDMSYFMPGIHTDMLQRFFTFFGSMEPSAFTIGMRIEIAVILVLSFIYFMMKTQRVFCSLFFVFLIYATIFSYGCLPFFLEPILHFIGLKFWPMDEILARSYVVITLALGIIVAYLAIPEKICSIVKDIRPLRNLHYQLMIPLGAVLAIQVAPIKITSINIFDFLFLPLSLFFGIMFSLVTNNITDIDIDRISNTNRPLVKRDISFGAYSAMQWPFLLMSILLGALVHFKILALILLFISNYYLYSMPPLRLKRIPFFSKLFISLNSLIMVMAGYFIINGSFNEFPGLIILYFLIVYTAPINFIDIKDYEGDKQNNIKTLPVLLGLKRSKQVIGMFWVITYIIAGLFIKNIFILAGAIIAGLLEYYLINRVDYKEKPVFVVYLLSLVCFIVYIFLYGLPT